MVGDKIERIKTYYEGTHGFLIDGDEDEIDLVRCKDCKWAEVSDNEHTWCDHVDHDFCHDNDWFCADGRKQNDT